jgi:16S rRNA (cytosine967-C5)-methyltransferase
MIKTTGPRRLAVDILDRVFHTASHADALLETWLTKSGLSGPDRGLCTEIVYGTLRWKARLDWSLARLFDGKWDDLPGYIQCDLEAGLYQIQFLNRVPDFAAVNEAVEIAKESRWPNWSATVNFILREALRQKDKLEDPVIADPVQYLSVRWSHPEWLVRRWVGQFGIERAEAICKANDERPRTGLRVSRLRIGRDELIRILRARGYDASPSLWMDEFIVVEKTRGLAESEPFRDGWFTIQDESAGLAALLMDPKPNETIWDVSSAPGGKATHMAERTRDRGRILATDLNAARLRFVLENVSRLGLGGIYPAVMDGLHPGLSEVDKILLDAPCSGLGVIRRRGELRWRKQESDIAALTGIQRALLESVAPVVRKGGTLVYSTCTVLPEENIQIVEAFLSGHPEFRIENAGAFVSKALVNSQGMVETWTDKHGMDGSFAVRLRKT